MSHAEKLLQGKAVTYRKRETDFKNENKKFNSDLHEKRILKAE